MFTEQYEQWFKSINNKPQAVAEWTKLGTDICQRTMQQQWHLMEENVSRVADQMKRFSNVKKPEEFINLQKEYFSENMSASMDYAQTVMKSTMENIEAVTKLCSQSQNQHSNQQQQNNKAGEKR